MSGASALGGNQPAQRNVVSGNRVGVYVGGSGAVIQGNYIGTDPTGKLAIPNAQGVFLNSAASTTIGGALPGQGNLISGNSSWGIRLDPAGGSTIFGNLIGTQADGTSPLGNTGPGIVVNQTSIDNNRIGDTAAGDANTIAFNQTGVFVQGGGRGDSIEGNSIYSNAGGSNGLGIDLAPGGVTPNDQGDGDTGPNELQNFPDLASATLLPGRHVQVTGTVTGNLPGSFYAVDFYASPSCSPSGNGEGARYLGSVSVQVGSFDTGSTLPGTVTAGDSITATTTDTFGDTSEFSQCVALPITGALAGGVAADPPPADVNLSALGTEDWAIWGSANGGKSTSLAPDSRKLGGNAISTLTNIDPDPSVVLRGLGQFPAAEPFYFGWANGSAPMNAVHVSGGLQHDGEQQILSTLNHGFGFDVPADTRTRTLRVYVATNRADGTLTASLSDGSAPTFVNVLPQAVDLRSAVYTIKYAAASAGQTLHVDWVETADNCSTTFQCDNAAIYAVALQAPSTYVVNTADDHNDGSCDATDCSLREAILAADAAGAPGVAGITFDLPGGGPQQISVANSPLPPITAPVAIDGTTEPGVPAGDDGGDPERRRCRRGRRVGARCRLGRLDDHRPRDPRLPQHERGGHPRAVGRQPGRRQLHRHGRQRDRQQPERRRRRRRGQQQHGRRPERGRPERHLGQRRRGRARDRGGRGARRERGRGQLHRTRRDRSDGRRQRRRRCPGPERDAHVRRRRGPGRCQRDRGQPQRGDAGELHCPQHRHRERRPEQRARASLPTRATLAEGSTTASR